VSRLGHSYKMKRTIEGVDSTTIMTQAAERFPDQRGSSHQLSTTPLPYMPQLDALRAFAVFAVMVSHFLPQTNRVANLGTMGVDLFFVLSGFLITGILLRSRQSREAHGKSLLFTVRHFYIRRFLRIFPLFYFVVLSAAIFNIGIARTTLSWHLTYLTNVLLFIKRDWDTSFGHFWSLAVEEQFYLVWPCIILLTPRRHLFRVIVATIALGPCFKITGTLAGMHPIFIRVLSISCLDMLGAGALLAIASNRGFGSRLRAEQIRRAGMCCGLPLLITGLVLRQFLDPDTLPVNTILDAAVGLFSVWLVAGAAVGFHGWAGKLLEWKPLVYLGTISYGIYVYHLFMPIEVWPRLIRRGFPLLPQPFLFLFFCGATIAVAALSWRFFERPINNLKRYFEYQEKTERV
jgi:peptidoglycan/LPS O-acetylase OafA/YrhL